jgi:hypothetical protein
VHNEELHNLYASGNIIRVIKSRRTRRARRLARSEHMINAYKILMISTYIFNLNGERSGYRMT